MNGANALPAVSVINKPSIKSNMTNGSSQNFFRTLRKPHISLTIDKYLMRASQ
jgi:hypothetical protein